MSRAPVAGAPTGTAVVLRPIGLRDLPGVLALHRQAFPHDGWTAQSFRDELAQPETHRWTVAETAAHDGSGQRRLLGFVGCAVAGDVVDLLSLAVTPDVRRAGVGTLLLADVLAHARFLGVGRVLLEVAAGNEAALALYTRLGFGTISRRARYYAGPGGAGTVDALVLERVLPVGGSPR